jgi:hypothetical protein
MRLVDCSISRLAVLLPARTHLLPVDRLRFFFFFGV